MDRMKTFESKEFSKRIQSIRDGIRETTPDLTYLEMECILISDILIASTSGMKEFCAFLPGKVDRWRAVLPLIGDRFLGWESEDAYKDALGRPVTFIRVYW